jgi:hypothetical protein
MAAQVLSALVISTAVLMGGIYAMKYAMKSLGADQEFKKVGSALEIYRLKKQNPLATGEDLKKAALRGKHESLGELLHNSKSGKIAEDELENGLRRISDGTMESSEFGGTAPLAQPQQHQQQQSQVIEFDGKNGIDPLAIDQVNALNVPESVRREILKNYERTGILPTLRKPSSN